MAPTESGSSLQNTLHHRRVKSSVLTSFMHKRTPSAGVALSTAPTPDGYVTSPVFENNRTTQFLPDDNPHSRALAELQYNQQHLPPSPPKKSREAVRPNTSEEGHKTLHKKTFSSVSLKSLASKGPEKSVKYKDAKPDKTKKTISTANLTSLLSRPKSSKSLKQETEQDLPSGKDKENRTPLTGHPDSRPPPIFAQFSSQHFAVQPLGGKFLESEIDHYTPEQYSPGKQRDFYQGHGSQPTLGRRDDDEHRPRSTYLPSSFSVQDISMRINEESSRRSAEIVNRLSNDKRPSFERKTTAPTTQNGRTLAKKGGRVLAAVTALSSKPKEPEAVPERVLEDKDINAEFEAMLDRRNIPEHQRGKMRSLAPSMKRDFVKQDWAEIAAAKNGRPGTNCSDSSADATTGTNETPEVKKRPRSRTFTLHRGSSRDNISMTKHQKQEATIGRHSRAKSSDSMDAGSRSLTKTGATVASTLMAKAKGQLPDDFVSYLRKIQKPELVEVGRLHKLRLLLRNETVVWTDDFVGQGGMEEIVGLLHRIMELEWREHHEDDLLHEVLLCLKALSTTALALQHLNQIQTSLFPALLHMLFDPEKKGPSEFNTRNIITSLLLIYLKSASITDHTHRAKILLCYLRDPEPKEEERPVGFVLKMHQPRPYRIWCKEVVNVTKEVFWIFLHNTNVIARPSPASSATADECSGVANPAALSAVSNGSFDAFNPHHQFMLKHFPKELPPVPAAPYVGGVEWDATNYLASHLDLINGILASLPSRSERNSLREELKVSGWERSMGCTLRTCKEKFYGGVHAGLRCWVAAAEEDGWATRDVRCGPSTDSRSPVRNNAKNVTPAEAPPKIQGLQFEFEKKKAAGEDAWL